LRQRRRTAFGAIFRDLHIREIKASSIKQANNRWEKKLYENIDRCDLFLLSWSQAAKDSQWILKEAEYALAHQQKNPGSEPDLVPVVLPPPNLSAFHFNDRISYLVSRKP
jgi:TIR domain